MYSVKNILGYGAFLFKSTFYSHRDITEETCVSSIHG